MQLQGPKTPYEVHCAHCNVTFPVGTRRCVHCGGRISRERGRLPDSQVSFGEGAGPPADESRRMSPFSPVALIWVLIFVAGTIYRACSSG
jgi:hypothetical protein